MPCVGFWQGDLRVTSCHVDKMGLAISALEGPGDIIYMPLLSIHISHHTACLGCPVNQRASSLPGFRTVVAPRSPHRPHPQPRFLHVTEESILISPQINPLPRTWNCPSSHDNSSLSFYFAILSPFLRTNPSPHPQKSWHGWWVSLWIEEMLFLSGGCRMFKGKEQIQMNENAVLSLWGKLCNSERLGIVRITRASGNEIPGSWFYDGLPPYF